MSETIICIKLMLKAALPSLLLGAIAYWFIALCQGVQGLNSVDGMWYFATFISFVYLLASQNDGKQMFARSIRYFAYELWALPLFLMIYFIVSGSQVTPEDKAIGAAAGTLGAIFVGGTVSIVAGLVGLIFYSISKNMLKKRNKV